MTDSKLLNDASSSTKGTIYQLYIAVQKCFELTVGQKIIIERYGDVTVSASQQLEIKYYKQPLTDNHPNFWKTLNNWMQDNFDESAYATLLLCTTQNVGEDSLLRDWNSKTVDERIVILQAIHEKAKKRELHQQQHAKNGSHHKQPEVFNIQCWVMDSIRLNKLQSVLSRFVIADLSPDIFGIYSKVKDVHTKGILRARCDDYLCALLGFVICPEVVEKNSWEISYNEFTTKVQELTAQYHKGTTLFPVKYLHPAPSQESIDTNKDKIFVRKIRDIEYHDVIHQAIVDYLYASQTVLHDLQAYEVPPTRYQTFAKNVLAQFVPRYRKALRNMSDVIKDSQDFYDEVMNELPPGFPGFETPPLNFKNGVIHIQSDTLDDIKWRLESS